MSSFTYIEYLDFDSTPVEVLVKEILIHEKKEYKLVQPYQRQYSNVYQNCGGIQLVTWQYHFQELSSRYDHIYVKLYICKLYLDPDAILFQSYFSLFCTQFYLRCMEGNPAQKRYL